MGANNIYINGQTSIIIDVELRDSTTGNLKTGIAAGSITASYGIEGANAAVSMTLDGTMTEGTWKTLGWKEKAGQTGIYQLGIPNAALASGRAVKFKFTGTGFIDKTVTAILNTADLRPTTGGAVVVVGTADNQFQSLGGGSKPPVLVSGTTVSGSTTTVVKTNIALASQPNIVGSSIMFTSGVYKGAKAVITSLSGGGVAWDLSVDILNFAVPTSITFDIVADHLPKLAGVAGYVQADVRAIATSDDAASGMATAGQSYDDLGYFVAADAAGAALAKQSDLAALITYVQTIQNNTDTVFVLPAFLERPDTGSTAFLVEILFYDTNGNMEAPDSAPTLAVANGAGTSRTANLTSSTGTLVGTGHYSWQYNVSTAHAMEQLVFTATQVEGGNTRTHIRTTWVADTTAVDFTASDRTDLQAAKAASLLVQAQTDKFAFTNPSVGVYWLQTDVRAIGTTQASANSLVTLLAEYSGDGKLNVHVLSLADDVITDASLAEEFDDKISSLVAAELNALKLNQIFIDALDAPAVGSLFGNLLVYSATYSKYIFTTAALSNGVGGGGGGQIILGPIVGSNIPTNGLGAKILLQMFRGERKVFILTGTAQDGVTLINFAGRTLRFVVHTKAKEPVGLFDVEAVNIAISGTSNELASVTVGTTVTATKTIGDYEWELWDVTSVGNEFVLLYGDYELHKAVVNVS